MAVLCSQGDRKFPGDGVESCPARLNGRGPLGIAPADAAEPAPRCGRLCGLGDAGNGLFERTSALEPYLSPGERPLWEVDVGIGESRQDAATPEIDALRARQGPFVGADPSRDAVSSDRKRTG